MYMLNFVFAALCTATLSSAAALSQRAPPSENIHLAEFRKLVATTGDFYAQDKPLGKGSWVSDNRFIVQVPDWGNVWWVSVLADGGMKTASTKTREEAMEAKPSHFEKYAPIDAGAPAADVRLSEFNKLLKRTAEFYVNDELLGYGEWQADGRMVVFVKSWGNLWWAGVPSKGGMYTATYNTKEEAQTGKPTHFEGYA